MFQFLQLMTFSFSLDLSFRTSGSLYLQSSSTRFNSFAHDVYGWNKLSFDNPYSLETIPQRNISVQWILSGSLRSGHLCSYDSVNVIRLHCSTQSIILLNKSNKWKAWVILWCDCGVLSYVFIYLIEIGHLSVSTWPCPPFQGHAPMFFAGVSWNVARTSKQNFECWPMRGRHFDGFQWGYGGEKPTPCTWWVTFLASLPMTWLLSPSRDRGTTTRRDISYDLWDLDRSSFFPDVENWEAFVAVSWTRDTDRTWLIVFVCQNTFLTKGRGMATRHNYASTPSTPVVELRRFDAQAIKSFRRLLFVRGGKNLSSIIEWGRAARRKRWEWLINSCGSWTSCNLEDKWLPMLSAWMTDWLDATKLAPC